MILLAASLAGVPSALAADGYTTFLSAREPEAASHAPTPPAGSLSDNSDLLLMPAPTWGESQQSADGSTVPAAVSVQQNAASGPLLVPPEPSQSSSARSSDDQRPPPDQGRPLRPDFLNGPVEPPLTDIVPPVLPATAELFSTPFEAPLGFAGPSSVLPGENWWSHDFIPIEDRWRIGFPEWDRYDKGHPPLDDYPYVEGHWWDPFNQNVLKGDYPIIGQHTFLRITASTDALFNFRDIPAPTTPFESTLNPGQRDFFGNPHQYFYTQYFALQTELFHGNADFKPVDWQIRLTPVFDVNDLDVGELGIVSPDVRNGTNRFRDDWALEEYFVEAKLADTSPDYDFVSIRAGSQPFTSDFRGFIFSDTNRAVRLFGTAFANQDQFNVAWFDQAEKDTNSFLNTFANRDQQVLIANYYHQDFIFPGFTAEASFHYDHDSPSLFFNDNGFLARPDPIGAFQQHEVDAYYLGLAGDGHIGRINVSDAFYWVLGHDSLNPIAGTPQNINAQMGAIELSYDRDWVRFRASYFYASGDNNIFGHTATGFDSIFANVNFAGGQFSYWNSQAIPLLGVNLTNRNSLVPDLRSSNFDGQANFVNPGLQLYNVGIDFNVTPKFRVITNANFLWFDTTQVLEQILQQSVVHSHIGTDVSLGIEYRPLLNDNVIILCGFAVLIPGRGFDDIYGSTPAVASAEAHGAPPAPEVGLQYSDFIRIKLTY